METSDSDHKKEDYQETFSKNLENDIRADVHHRIRQHHTSGRVGAGLVIVIIGSIFLARQLGVYFPDWVFTWPCILIAVGIYTGARHSFRSGGWIAMVGIGAVFLLDAMVPGLGFYQYLWPVVIIVVGLMMILRPRKIRDNFNWHAWKEKMPSPTDANSSDDDFLDSTAVFGGVKKNIFSKNFRGGDITTFFGGVEVNLSQADINGTVRMDITQFFGGTKLIVPSNWKIKSEVVTIFGSFEDKRPVASNVTDPNKLLIIDGTCVFGGIDIKSF